jgi:autotransporter-associated beta strand protein
VGGLAVVSGAVLLTGNASFGQAGTESGLITGPISDGGNHYGITKIGASATRLTLSGANTYSGNTGIASGTLALGASGSIASSPNISLSNNAAFDVSTVSGGFSLGANQTLRGGGSFALARWG